MAYMKDFKENFPEFLNIGFSICTEECGSYQYTVCGRTTLCDYCKRPYKTVAVCKYKLGGAKDSVASAVSQELLSELTPDEKEYASRLMQNGVFDKEIHISLAVCDEKCGNHAFIYDGGSQICEKCGDLMFRILTEKYTRAE